MAKSYTEDQLFRSTYKPADENDWPTFTLNNVTVYNKQNEVASLLDASAQQPLRVVGTLESPGRRLGKLLVARPPAQPWNLSIDCTHYSYGTYDNGEVDIWAAGDAGWLLINPSPQYKRTHQDMVAAVRLFYQIADAYGTDKKAKVEGVLRSAAKALRIPMRGIQDLFTDHQRFFGIQMAGGAEIGSWSRTTIYQFLKEHNPEALGISIATTRKRAISKPMVDPEPDPARAGLRRGARIAAAKMQAIVSAAEPSKKPVRTGRAARYENVTKNSVDVPDADDKDQQEAQHSQAVRLWKGIEQAVKQSDFNREEATFSNVSQEILTIFNFTDDRQAADYIRLHAKDLSAIIASQPSRKDSWQNSQFYLDMLTAKLSKTAAAKLQKLDVRIRNDRILDESMSDSDESEESGPRTPRHGKGALRPVSGKKSAKRYTGKGKGRMRDDEPEDPEEDDDMESDGDGISEHAGTKRKAPRDSLPVRKSKRVAGFLIESESEAEEGADEEMLVIDEDDDATSPNPVLPKKNLLLSMNLDFEEGTSSETPASSLLYRPNQDMDTNDAGDVWRCKHDGCMFTAYGASKDDGQALIREHLDGHDTMIKAVLGEQAKTHKPVGHLLRLLREKAGGYPDALRAMLEGNKMDFAAPVATMM